MNENPTNIDPRDERHQASERYRQLIDDIVLKIQKIREDRAKSDGQRSAA